MVNDSLNTRSMKAITLSDKFARDAGAVFLTGVQALVRIVLEQARRDRNSGLDTAGFISGYRGSPLGGLDIELWAAQEVLNDSNIHFQPAINEELAATAILGTQQVGLFPGAKTDGVFSLWYGKGVGADRASDALKHANLMGSSPRGGVLVVVGDDHGAMSSATAHQCDQAMESWLMPYLHPCDLQEYVDFGLLGIAMSRYAGCYVGFKAVSDTVESGAVIDLPSSRSDAIEPSDFALPPGGLNIRTPDPQLEQEARHINHRLKAAQAFARVNRIDREIWPRQGARIGVITVGKSHGDFLQAMEDMGIDERAAGDLGVAVYKVGMPWPLEPDGIREFATGLETLLVIEEKRSFVEKQVKDILFNLPHDKRPKVLGKENSKGESLLSSAGQLTSAAVAIALNNTIPDLGKLDVAAGYLAFLEQTDHNLKVGSGAMRIPHFCAGCPHSVSTRVPEGSRAHAGTGCHLMAAYMDRETTGFLQMGGDGVNWTGQAPFTQTSHVFQNMGDGTYFHSGSLAIRQAIAARANITFKILNNDAVAMTGGQPIESKFNAADISHQIYSEGVQRIAVVYDQLEHIPAVGEFAPGTTCHPRQDFDRVQREFRDVAGVSVIIYVQACAAQLRRKRQRGEAEKIKRRAFINPDVCEGCGDCAVQSSCPALTLIDTPMGRKRRIDQSMCNGDLTCLEGLCPSFITVDGQMLEDKGEANLDHLPKNIPLPAPFDLTRPYNVVVAGVGGNGIVTLGHILAMAALQEGKGASTLDFTGLSQKGGGVVSHVRLSAHPGIIAQPRIPTGGADLMLAGDMIMACSKEALSQLNPDRSGILINTFVQLTAAQISNGDVTYDLENMQNLLRARTRAGAADFINATRLAEHLGGQSILANLFLLGYAFQKGVIPLGREAILNAITLNGVKVGINTQCFEWGRFAAHDPNAFEKNVGPLADSPPVEETIEESIDRLASHLEKYQDAAYAGRYKNLVKRVQEKENEILSGSHELTRAVANSYARLLAYKDEYEVARLHTENNFTQNLRKRFDGACRISYHLAPDLLARKDPADGRHRKRAYGAWMTPVLEGLAKLKVLRGTRFDVFAYTHERQNERALIKEYETVINDALNNLTLENHARYIDVARAPEKVKGFGLIKQPAIEEMRRFWGMA